MRMPDRTGNRQKIEKLAQILSFYVLLHIKLKK